MQRLLLLLGFFGVLCVVTTGPINNQIETDDPYAQDTARRRAIALQCISQVSIDPKFVVKAMSSDVQPKSDPLYKQFLTCSYKKQGYQTQDGTKILYNNIKEFLERFYRRADLEVLNVCESVQGVDDGDLAYNALGCILAQLRRLQSINNARSK